jgi:predicted house-cleaning noncanonical NTP pyrophosphatase (MazG superfamily)
MKIIITEQQQKLLTESKSLEFAQNLINQAFEELKENCEKNWVEQYACDQMETIEKVKVVSSDKGSTITRDKKTNFWLIQVDIYYSSLGYTPFEDFIYQLQYEVREIVGSRNIIITIQGLINSNKDLNW